MRYHIKTCKFLKIGIVLSISLLCLQEPLKADVFSQRRQTIRDRILKARDFRKNSNSRQKSEDDTGKLKSGDQMRSYLIHVPKGLNKQGKYPLILAFHGGVGTGEKFKKYSRLNKYADREGFLVVYPNGIERSWNDGRGTTKAEQMGIDDVQFVRDLIRHLSDQYPIDEARVYATGASNGGMMTYRLGCEAADLFAAIAPDIANLPEPLEYTCKPSRPIPLIAINGMADPLVPYEGGKCCGNPNGFLKIGQGGEVLSTEHTLSIFTQSNGCKQIPSSETMSPKVNDGTKVERRIYSCPEGADIVSYVVHGMGHTWPPHEAQIQRISGQSSQNINASETFLNFFKKFRNTN